MTHTSAEITFGFKVHAEDMPTVILCAACGSTMHRRTYRPFYVDKAERALSAFVCGESRPDELLCFTCFPHRKGEER
jgi:hypothetical protein